MYVISAANQLIGEVVQSRRIRRFQPGEGPSRGLLRDCATGCGTDGALDSTIIYDDIALITEVENICACYLFASHSEFLLKDCEVE